MNDDLGMGEPAQLARNMTQVMLAPLHGRESNSGSAA